MARPADLPEFAKPPVHEVALGIQFKPLLGFQSVHSGLLRDVFRDRFPDVAEHPPLYPEFETFGPHGSGSTIEFALGTGTPPIRYWFLTKPRTELVQFQPDRFVHNWRKVAGTETYPRFDTIVKKFSEELIQLDDFAAKCAFGSIVPTQCELTYVNHIPLEGEFAEIGRLGEVFRFWSSESALVPIETARFQMRSIINDSTDVPVGRLHVEAGTGIINGRAGIVLTLVARGRPSEPSIAGAVTFLTDARSKIVRTFDEITTDKMHQLWERRS